MASQEIDWDGKVHTSRSDAEDERRAAHDGGCEDYEVYELVAAHRAGQRTEHRPDLIDADGDRWVWTVREGYSADGGQTFHSRALIELARGHVTEAGGAETEETT